MTQSGTTSVKSMKQNRCNNNYRCVDDCQNWWFRKYNPSTLRWKWVLTISMFGASLLLLFFDIPAISTTTTTTSTTTTNNIMDVYPKNSNVHVKNTKSTTDSSKVVTFHLAFTVPKFTILNQRCIESIFYFHPTARVILHSNADNGLHTAEPQVLEPIQELIHRGYHIEIIPYKAADILQRAIQFPNSIVNATLAQQWMALISTKYSHEKYWYSNESNLLRLCLLYVDGGIYLDTDVILVRPMVTVINPPSNTRKNDDARKKNNISKVMTDYNGLNVDNVMARDGKSFECAVMKFLYPGNLFLGHAINTFLRYYNGTDWGNNGPRVFGRTSKAMPYLLCPEPYNYSNVASSTTIATTTTTSEKIAPPANTTCSMQPLPSESFQPVPWRTWLIYCFDTNQSPVGINATMIIRRPNVYAVHMNNHIFGTEIERHIYVKNSICDIVMTKFCILCTSGVI